MLRKISEFKCVRLDVMLEAFYDAEQMRVLFKIKDISYSISKRSNIEKAVKWCETQTIKDVVTFKDAEKFLNKYKSII